MTVALYVRTSTDDQDGAAQLHALRRAAQARGWAAAEYVDRGQSGAKASRPELDRLKAAVARGEVSTVAVYRLDRLGRSLTDVVQLLDTWARQGCAFVSLSEALDFTTPAGRLMGQLLAAFAEFERNIIRERVRSGIARAQAQGTRSGRPIGRPAREVDTAQLARLRASGASWRACAVALKVPVRTLRRHDDARMAPFRLKVAKSTP